MSYFKVPDFMKEEIYQSLTRFVTTCRFSISHGNSMMLQTLDTRRVKGQSRFVSIGDVALIKLLPATYRIGRVEQLLKDPEDGFVKTAAIKWLRGLPIPAILFGALA